VIRVIRVLRYVTGMDVLFDSVFHLKSADFYRPPTGYRNVFLGPALLLLFPTRGGAACESCKTRSQFVKRKKLGACFSNSFMDFLFSCP
jgi:hypothetical protein